MKCYACGKRVDLLAVVSGIFRGYAKCPSCGEHTQNLTNTNAAARLVSYSVLIGIAFMGRHFLEEFTGGLLGLCIGVGISLILLSIFEYFAVGHRMQFGGPDKRANQ